MEAVVNIGGNKIKMRATALMPRLYRFKFGRDIIKDMSQLEQSFKKACESKKSEEDTTAYQLSVMDLTIFENIAYIMCKQANPDIPDSPDEWLDSIDGVFSIYEILPTIIGLWNANEATTSHPKKK